MLCNEDKIETMTNDQEEPSTSDVHLNTKKKTKEDSAFCDNISIKTIQSIDCESSEINSDSDFELSVAKKSKSNKEIVLGKRYFPSDDKIVTIPNIKRKISVKSIAIQNSSGITFGDKEHYEGPVKVEQYIYDSDKWRQISADEATIMKQKKVERSKDRVRDRTTLRDQIIKLITNRYIVVGIILGIINLMAIISLTVLFLHDDNSSDEEHIPPNPDEFPLRIVSRNDWLAQIPVREIPNLTRPISIIIIAQTRTETCFVNNCSAKVRDIQSRNIESEFKADIRYNFLIGDDLNVHEGRGWNKIGEHTDGYDNRSLCIALIGSYDSKYPSLIQEKFSQKLIGEGVKEIFIDPKYKLYCQGQLRINSKDNALCESVQKWPHWTPV